MSTTSPTPVLTPGEMEARQNEMLARQQEASLKSAEFNSKMSILQTQLEDMKAAARTK